MVCPPRTAIQEIVRELSEYVRTAQQRERMPISRKSLMLSLSRVIENNLTQKESKNKTGDLEDHRQPPRKWKLPDPDYDPTVKVEVENQIQKARTSMKYSSYSLEFKRELVEQIKQLSSG